MKLFWRRPLALSCFLFLLLSFVSSYISFKAKLPLIIALVSIMILIAAAFFLIKKEKIRNTIFIIFMCFVFVLLAAVNNYVRIDIPRSQEESREGITTAQMLVISKESSSEYRTEYIVKIKRMGEDKTNVKAVLVCDGKGTAAPFDTIYATVDISPSTDSTVLYYGGDVLLTAYLYEEFEAVVSTDGNGVTIKKTFSNGLDGIAIGLNFLRDRISDHIVDLFGTEAGSLAAGLLMNDTSDISNEVTRDFRRAGVSHLLAVSGLHISLLIGAVELLLKKLRVPKSARYPILALAALMLLILAGFSMSACRSVFMLLVLYLCYIFLEGSDSISSLFLSVTIIVLISPYAIYDLGLFMSFSATLGLVTVYPIFESFSRRVLANRNILFKILRGAFNIVAITIIANIFILPISWIYFGELSIAAIPVNLLASPIISLLLPLIAIGVLLGRIALVGNIIVWIVGFLSDILLNITRIFSRMSGATVSLKYDFAVPIIVIFIAVMIVFLVIDIKKKWILFLPPVMAVLAFSISLAVFNLTVSPELTYYSYRNKDAFFSVDKGGAVIVDLSRGGAGTLDNILELVGEETAVYLKRIVITSPSRKALYPLERVMKNNILEEILLPTPKSNDEKEVVNEIYRLAESCGVCVKLYEMGECIELTSGISLVATGEGSAYLSDGKEVVSYTNQDKPIVSGSTNSDIIIIGSQNKKEVEIFGEVDGYLILSSSNITVKSEKDLSGRIYSISYPYYIELFGLFE